MSSPPNPTVKTPAQSIQPPPQPDPSFGWTAYAEQTNGRFAMIGFLLLLILEFISDQGFLTWLGLQ